MAKTIKEMAEDYAYINFECEDYHEGAAEGLPFDPIGHTERAYLAGANAVLDEIVRFMEDGVRINFRSFTAIRDKIEQLKGE